MKTDSINAETKTSHTMEFKNLHDQGIYGEFKAN